MPQASCDVCGSKDNTTDVTMEYRDCGIEVICFKCNEEVITFFGEVTKTYAAVIAEKKRSMLVDWLKTKEKK